MPSLAPDILVPVTQLAKHPEYIINEAKLREKISLMMCKTCGQPRDTCFRENTQGGKWLPSHPMEHYTGTTVIGLVDHIWLKLAHEIKLE